MMKRTKGDLGIPDSRVLFRNQCLLQDYKDLQQESEAVKEKLERAKQKKLTLMAEVRFLRRRYKYLMTNQFLILQSKQYPVQLKNPTTQSKNVTKKQNYKARGTAVPRTVPAGNINKKGRIIGKETTLRNPVPRFDQNHKERNYKIKEAAVQNSPPAIDLNQNVTGCRETDHSWKEATVRKMTPVFDLNQISREEEELQEPLKIEEAKKILIRAVNDEHHSDTKLPVCRKNIGNRSSQAGKRKISWQDQVAF